MCLSRLDHTLSTLRAFAVQVHGRMQTRNTEVRRLHEYRKIYTMLEKLCRATGKNSEKAGAGLAGAGLKELLVVQ